jgi:hypothetical protein
MPSSKQGEAARPARSFGRGFTSSDPERQREVPADGTPRAREDDAPAAPAGDGPAVRKGPPGVYRRQPLDG